MKRIILLIAGIIQVIQVSFTAKKSFAQWEPDIRLTNDPDISYPSYNNARNIAAGGDTVHVVWYDHRSGYYLVYYKRSTDNGLSWGGDKLLTNIPVGSSAMYPSLALSGNHVYVVWHSDQAGNGYDVYFKRSADGGETWEPDDRLTNDAAFSGYPSLAASGDTIHVTWYDERDANYEIYYKRSTNSGTSWEDDFRLTDDPASSAFPFIAGTDSALHVMWQDFRDGNPEIYYKRFLVENPGTGIRSIATNPSKAFSLGQNQPNPCSSTTKIKFQVAGTGNANITLYDMFGKEAATLFNEKLMPGTYEITFDASGLTNGIYYYCLRTGNLAETKKMILLK